MLAVLPFVVSIAVASQLGYTLSAALIVLVGFGAMLAAHEFLVPLVPRGT